MAAVYRQVWTRFWLSLDIKPLTPNQKLLALYLITSPHGHLSGIYWIPLAYAARETGLSQHEVAKCVAALEDAKIVCYDHDSEVVWVRNMLPYQNCKGAKNLTGVANHMKGLPGTVLIGLFLNHYSSLHIPYRYPIDTVSIPYRWGISMGKTTEGDEPGGSLLLDCGNDGDVNENSDIGYPIDGVCDKVYPVPVGKTEGIDVPVPDPVRPSEAKAVGAKSPKASVNALTADAITHLNLMAGRSFKGDSETNRDLVAKLRDAGHGIEQIKQVIDAKSKEWSGTDMAKYLRPGTLFSKKFKSYLDNDVGTGAAITSSPNTGRAKPMALEDYDEPGEDVTF